MSKAAMRLGTAGLCLALALLAATRALPAVGAGVLGVDSTQPIAVNADSFVADLNSETGLYTGNVIVTQGAIRLHADRVRVSAPGGKAARMEADGHVVVDSPSGQAVGDSGVYEVAQQVLRLTGNVVLTKDANVMRGDALEVSMATGIAHLTAEAQSGTANPLPGRVQGLFVPAPGPDAGPPPASAPGAVGGTPPNP